MNKKILSGALAAMMLMAPAKAAGGGVISANNGNGDVPVHLTQETTQFSVTVPTVLPVDISATGVVTVANENKIINNSFGPVEVKSVSVQSLGDWKLVDFDTDFKSKKVGLHEYGFQMNDTNVQPDGSCTAVFEVIPGNGQINFDYDSKVATQNTALNKENIANVVFTIGWSGQQGATNTLSKSKMDAALKSLTGKLTFTTTAYHGEGGIDISEAGNGSVMAVVSGQDATVYSDGGVIAINSSSINGMFEEYQAREMDLHGLDTSNMTNISQMFYKCRYLRFIDLSGLNMSQVTDANWMFGECNSLLSLDLSDVNMHQVTDVHCMFASCTSLSSVNLSGIDTSNATNAYGMFNYCSALNSLDLSGLNMERVGNACNMFTNCNSLTSLDLSCINLNQVTDTSDMFSGCTALRTLDLSGINMSQVTSKNFMFENCKNLKTCYAKTSGDCYILNNTYNKPSNVKFIVKPSAN